MCLVVVTSYAVGEARCAERAKYIVIMFDVLSIYMERDRNIFLHDKAVSSI